MKIGRIIGVAVLGLAFGFFVGVDLVLFGVVPLASSVVTVLLVVGLVAGGVLGWLSGRRRSGDPVA